MVDAVGSLLMVRPFVEMGVEMAVVRGRRFPNRIRPKVASRGAPVSSTWLGVVRSLLQKAFCGAGAPPDVMDVICAWVAANPFGKNDRTVTAKLALSTSPQPNGTTPRGSPWKGEPGFSTANSMLSAMAAVPRVPFRSSAVGVSACWRTRSRTTEAPAGGSTSQMRRAPLLSSPSK